MAGCPTAIIEGLVKNALSAFRFKLLPLFLLTSAAGFAAPKPDSNFFRSLSSPWVSSWALADFDGDSEIDLATASSGRSDARGYAHEVSLSVGGSFIFHNGYAKVRLSARDMDGDQDRDLLILEATSLLPVGIWLTDGSGHFAEGNLADFSDALETHDRGSFACPLQTACALAISVQPALLRNTFVSQHTAIEVLRPTRTQAPADTRSPNLRARAPPAFA